MAILSNINGKFAVDSTGAIQFSGAAGTSGYVLKSTGSGTAPTWVDASTVIGGPYVQISGDTMTGNLALTGGGNPSLTVSTGVTNLGGKLTVSYANPAIDLAQADGGAHFRMELDGGDETYLSTIGSNSMILRTNSTTALTLDTSQNATFAGNIRTGTSSLTANTNFDNLVIEGSAHTGITIFSGTSSDGGIYFGDSGANNLGQIKYLHSSNAMTFATNDGSASLTLDSGLNATFGGNVDVTGSIIARTNANYYSTRTYLGETWEFASDTTDGVTFKITGGAANTTGNFFKFQTQAGGATAATALTINKDLSATFAGNVTLGSSSKASAEWMYIDSDSSNSAGIQLLRGGLSKWFIYNPGGGNNFKIYDNSGGGYMEMAVGGNTTFSSDIQAPGIYVGSTNTSFDFYNNGTTYLNGATTIDDTLTVGATTITSATSMLLTLNPTANNYGGILFQYGGVTKGTSIYNSGIMVYGGESGVQTRIQAGGQYNLTALTTGEVGIGTVTPTHKLHIYSAAPTGGIGLKVESGNATNWIQNKCTAGSWQIGSTGSGFQLYNDDTAAYRFTVSNAGNVGIGTTSPGEKLTVAGKIEIKSGNWLVLRNSDNSNYGSIRGASDTSNDITINTNSEVIRFKQNGNVGIGNTGPNNKLEISDTGTGTGSTHLKISRGADSSAVQRIAGIKMGNTASNDGSNWIIQADSSLGYFDSADLDFIHNAGGTPSTRMALTSTGTLTVSGDVVAYGSPSDIRLKENIKPIKNPLGKIKKLKGITFDWKKSESILDIKEDYGFIAQDVQKVIPELVRKNENELLSMRHQGVIPILVEAIKELEARVKELENK